MRAEVPACCYAGVAVSLCATQHGTWSCPHAFAVPISLFLTMWSAFHCCIMFIPFFILILLCSCCPICLSVRLCLTCTSWSENEWYTFCSIGPVSVDKIHYSERFIELMIDLEVRNILPLPLVALPECKATKPCICLIMVSGEKTCCRCFCRAHLLLSFTYIANATM